MIDPKVVLLIFVSGKLVLTGARSVEALSLAFFQDVPWETSRVQEAERGSESEKVARFKFMVS